MSLAGNAPASMEPIAGMTVRRRVPRGHANRAPVVTRRTPDEPPVLPNLAGPGGVIAYISPRLAPRGVPEDLGPEAPP